MKKAKKLLAKLMVFALIMAYIPAPANSVSAASSKVSTKMYTISKKAGTYTSAFKITITAKKGYKVYYSTGSSLNIKKVIKSGKKKTIKISKTTTLKVYGVKKSTAITKKKLKTSAVKKKTKSYKYTIKTSDDTATADTTVTDTTAATTTAAAATEKTAATEKASTTEKNSATEATTEKKQTTEATTEKPALSITDSEKIITLSVSSSNDTDNPGIATTTEEDNNNVTVSLPGTYTLTGYAENLHISVDASNGESAESYSEPVTLILDSVNADNSNDTSNSSLINIGDGFSNVTVKISGESKVIGSNNLTKANSLINSSSSSTTVTLSGDNDAALSYVDSMSSDSEIISDGISCKGALIIESGAYNIYTNGDCIKSTSSDITINGGTFDLTSYQSVAVRSKGGNVTISDGDFSIGYTGDNGIQAKKGITISGGDIIIENCQKNGVKAKEDIIISGGTINVKYTGKDAVNTDAKIAVSGSSTKVTIDNCYGDGIQGEYIDIKNGTIDITTYYEYAATNFYEDNWTGVVNSKTGETTKTEVINYDTGSHKALKAGTKAKTYSYKSILKDTALEALTEYTQEASGGLTISGGTITLDTTNTGIKYNGGSMGGNEPGSTGPGNGGTPPNMSNGGSSGGSGNGGTPPAPPSGGNEGGIGGGDDQTIIGSPDDAIHSNNTADITGGTITIYSSDDGITVADTLNITGNANIDIKTAYEGIEGGYITIGTTDSSAAQPTVKVYTNDDGINAAAKENETYVYADENEETYTKTSTAGSKRSLTVNGGTVIVTIADDTTHSVTLSGTAEDGSGSETYTFSASGDGIDCNGSFYAKGGFVIVNGQKENNNSPIDTDVDYEIAAGATVLAIGSNMDSGPNKAGQAYITATGSIGSSGKAIEIQDETGNKLFSSSDYNVTLKDSISYLLFTNPSVSANAKYKVIVDGTTATTLTATTSVSSH